jgi:hypothetical protein
MRSRFTSPSANSTAGSAIVCASPAYLTAIGLSTCGAAALAIWFSGSSVDTGTVLWRLNALSGDSVQISFPAPIRAACQLGVAASGAGASAMTAWDL